VYFQGKFNKAIQCNLCCIWVHGSCDGISREDYQSLVQLSNKIYNVAYYCKLNNCFSRIKQLKAIYVKIISTPDEINGQTDQERDEIRLLTCKIQSLSEQTIKLEDKVTDILEHLNVCSPSSSQQPDPTPLIDTVNELADRESRKCNLIIFNLQESSTPNINTDTLSFNDMCNFLNVRGSNLLNNTSWEEVDRGQRPLLVCLTNTVSKWKLLSQSPKLRTSTEWRNVYINPDMTATERKANQLLQDELNLVIWRNKIVILTHSK